MSPHEMVDCRQAVDALYELLDHELSPELEAAVTAHFENCPECFSLFKFESGFKKFLRARAHTPAAPEALRRRIFEQLIQSDIAPPQDPT